MKQILIILSLLFIFTFQSSCDSRANSKKATLQQCKTLGDESILYARANYVKLFNSINPEKFKSSFQKIKDFDQKRHRSIINTYDIAVRKIKTEDPISQKLLKSCKELSKFTQEFVDKAYPRAISFKNQSKLDPLADDFFLEINKIVKFDHTIGKYDEDFISFKQYVNAYEAAVSQFFERNKDILPK